MRTIRTRRNTNAVSYPQLVSLLHGSHHEIRDDHICLLDHLLNIEAPSPPQVQVILFLFGFKKHKIGGIHAGLSFPAVFRIPSLGGSTLITSAPKTQQQRTGCSASYCVRSRILIPDNALSLGFIVSPFNFHWMNIKPRTNHTPCNYISAIISSVGVRVAVAVQGNRRMMPWNICSIGQSMASDSEGRDEQIRSEFPKPLLTISLTSSPLSYTFLYKRGSRYESVRSQRDLNLAKDIL